MSRFGWVTNMVSVAKTGVMGNLKEVKNSVWLDFIQVLAVTKAQE